MEIIKKTIRLVNVVNTRMYVLIGVIITFLTIMVFYDTVARYLFNSPSSFGFDVVVWLTGVLTFVGGGYVLMKNEHIRVDVFYEKFSERTKAIVNLLSHLFIFLTVIVLVWWGGLQVLTLYEKGSIATTGFNVYMWIKWMILPVGGILLGLQAFVTLFKDLYLLISGQKFEGEN